MKKKQINIVRWIITGAFFASFIFFLLPYLSINVDGFSKGVSGLMCFFQDLGAVETMGSILFKIIFFLAPLCLTLISGVFLATKLAKRSFLIAAILGLVAFVLYVSYFVYFRNLIKNSGVEDNMITLAAGFYCNAALALLTGIMSIVLCAVFGSKTAGSNAQNVQSISGGIITGVSGMYRNAAINLNSGEEIIIGRDSLKSHIVVDENADKISRKHCGVMFDAANRTYSVIDYSSNGTFKEDGTRFIANMPTPVSAGSVIVLGSKQNSFRLG